MNSDSDIHRVLKEWVEFVMRRSMHGLFLYAKEHGHSMSQLGALLHINRKGVSGIADIGVQLGVTSAAVSQMIERMVQQGLIARTEDPADRRAKRIELTQEGMQVIGECVEARERWMDDLSASMSPKERKLAVSAITLLIDKTKEMELKPS